jgi:hypothetical protein
MQRFDQLIDVASWEVDEQFGIFPVGSKPKRLMRCPEGVEHPFLIARHPYLFKQALGRLVHQLWSEVVAYRLAAVIGLVVPRSIVAIDSARGQLGVLVEFFLRLSSRRRAARVCARGGLSPRTVRDRIADGSTPQRAAEPRALPRIRGC